MPCRSAEHLVHAIMPSRSIPTPDSVVYNDSIFSRNAQENRAFARFLVFLERIPVISMMAGALRNTSAVISLFMWLSFCVGPCACSTAGSGSFGNVAWGAVTAGVGLSAGAFAHCVLR